MNEIRCDPLTGSRVLIAEGRGARPCDFTISHQIESQQHCPFCFGNENDTPDEVLRLPASHDPEKWQTRIVSNKYPALAPLSRTLPPGDPSADTRSLPHEKIPPQAAEGIHEVIIESPDHCIRTTDLMVDHLAAVLQIVRKRMEQIKQIPELKSVQVFKNVGPTGGATIEHAHSQLIALPLVPPTIEREAVVSDSHFQHTGSCVLCDLWSNESSHRQRLVDENPGFGAFCAYAGRQPGETWIVPKKHQRDFTAIDDTDCHLLAEILHSVLQQIDQTFNVPAYNYMLLTAPLDGNSAAHYHWRWVIVPRITIRAGFEWGTGCFINPVSPERAAEAMRRRLPIDDIAVEQDRGRDIA